MDDVHWIDPGSDSFLAHAAETVPQTRTLVLLNFRPEYSAAWMQRSYYQQIPLRPLGQAASESILNDLLGEDPSLEQLKGQIREKTTGNPFFMEELVHSLSEAGSLVGQPGSYRLVEPTAAPTLPPSVQAVLDARIDRLDERDKMALQAAAVIGPEFAEPLLRRVTDLEESELAAALSRLCQSEFLFERALYPEAEYAFVHPLTQEVAYGTQLREHKMVLHRAAAAGLEELDPKKLDENAALIAHHLEEGGEHLASARWHARAAKWTHDTNATESARHWRQVRTLLEGVPESDETLQLGLRAVGGSLDLAWRVGSTADERTELFRHGEALASRTGDPSALPRLYCIYGLLRQAVGDLTPGRSYLLKALEGCRQAGNPEIQASALSALVYWDLEGGNLREAASRDEELERVSGGNVDLGSELHGFSPYLMNLGNRAAIQMYLGRLEDAARTLEKARELALKHSDLEGLGNALGHSTTLAGILGNSQEALRHARSDVDAAERLGSPAFRSGAYCALGKAFVFGGEWSEAIAACEGALALTKEAHLPQTEIDIFATLVRARLGAGKIPEAREAAEEAVKLAGRFPQLFMGGLSADLALVRFLLRGGGDTEYQRIEAVLDRIEHDAREREIALYIPLVHGERAELAQLHGDANRRMRELREAHRLFTEMGATGQAERISRELK
jgi:adenylate cyclase